MISHAANENAILYRTKICITRSLQRTPRNSISACASVDVATHLHPRSLRALHLVVALHSLRICWWNIGAWARRLCWCGSRWSHEAVLLTGELRIWPVVAHSAVSLLASALAARRILWLALDVVVRHVSLLFVVDLFVGRIGRNCDNIPCVEEAWEEAEHCLELVSNISVRCSIAKYGLLQSAMLIRLSAEQMPLFTQTARGGKIMATRPRKMSLPHILD